MIPSFFDGHFRPLLSSCGTLKTLLDIGSQLACDRFITGSSGRFVDRSPAGLSRPSLIQVHCCPAHSAFSQVVILALADPKNWILATGQAWNNFIQIEKLNFIPLSQPKLNFIPLSQPKLNFILLSGKSAVGQHCELARDRSVTGSLTGRTGEAFINQPTSTRGGPVLGPKQICAKTTWEQTCLQPDNYAARFSVHIMY